MNDEYIRSKNRQLITEEDMLLWLSRGDLKAETERKLDQALQTNYFAIKILQKERDSKCRLREKFDETVDQILSACPLLAKEQ
jgi:hypothetical protein